MIVQWIKSNGDTVDITNFISTMTWSGSASQASRSLEFTVAYSPYDDNVTDLSINLGDRVRLCGDKKELLIDIMVNSRERTNQIGTITYSGFDDLNRLLKSDMSYNFKNFTPEKIVEKLANELKFSLGSIAKTNFNIKSMPIEKVSYYNVINRAYYKAYKVSGKKYMQLMIGRKLSVIEKGQVIDNFELRDNVNITNATYTENLDSMINKVKIYNDKGKQIGEVKNDSNIDKFGIFQSTYTKEDGINATTGAKSLLNGIEKTASIEGLGNIACISGYGIKIKDTATNLVGTFWITSDSHTFENGNHTMSLELAFKNIMEVG